MTNEVGETVVGWEKPNAGGGGQVVLAHHTYFGTQGEEHPPFVTFLPRKTLESSSSINLSPLSQMVTIFSPGTHSLETSARTFSEICAAVLYLVRVSGLLRE